MTVLLPRMQRRSRFLFEYSAKFTLERRTEAAISGQAPTFTRASIGSSIGSDGRVILAQHSMPRYEWVDLDGDGIRESVVRLFEDTRVNLCLQSENFGTTWAAVGTPTRTAAAHTADGATLDLLGDDDGGVLEGYTQTVTFTGNAVKALSVYVKKDTSTSSAFRLRDTTAGADRLLAVVTWSGTVPSVAMTTGTYLGSEALADGVYRLLFATTSVTAANTNSVQLYPATTSGLATANTGRIYAGGVQAENALTPSSYLKTTTGTVTRAADAFSFPFNAPPQAMTWYARFIERGTIATGTTTGLLGIGASTNPALLLLNSGSATYQVIHRRSGDVSSTAAATPTFGQLVELRAILNADGSVQLGQSIAGAAEVVAAASAANALAAAWNNTTLTINERGGAVGYNAFQAVRIALGVQSLAYMRAGG